MDREQPALFRITRVDGPASRSATSTTLKLEGRLTAASLAELARACEPFQSRPETLELDASGVVYLDEPAILALQRAAHRHVRISGCSPFISELLRERKP